MPCGGECRSVPRKGSGGFKLRRRTGRAGQLRLLSARMSMASRPLVIAGREFRSRLILGTGKFPSPEAMRDALAASGTKWLPWRCDARI